MWLFLLIAAAYVWFHVQQAQKEKETLLGMVAALLARNPEDLESYRELVGYSAAFGPNDQMFLAGYGGDKSEMVRQVALMKEALRRVDLHSVA